MKKTNARARGLSRALVGAGGVLAGALLLSAGLGACRSADDSPEAQIRSLIARAEKAAEEKDLATLKELISDSYAGREAENKRMLVRVLGYHLLRNKSIHLFTQIHEIELPQPKRAEATLYVAMAARAIEGVQQLAGLRAEIYRVDARFADEGEASWKLTYAEWRQAEVQDLG